jgi:uncharacterized Ntn-hydrolase superfamily protein
MMTGGWGGEAVTYSVVARDDLAGELGVAVQACMFAVGSLVPWARPGVGVVVSQAISGPACGPRCLDGLAAGRTAAGALGAAQAADPLAALRQVGVAAADGTVAVATGALCIDHAGHVMGDGFAVQANMMSSPGVWPAMASAFESSAGPVGSPASCRFGGGGGRGRRREGQDVRGACGR